MKTYDKAVRDRIPEMIERSGKTCVTEVLPPEEFERKLNEKLREEVEEYLESRSIEELADLVEVVYGILEMRNILLEQFEELRLAKKKERGGFSQRICLRSVSD